MPRNLGATGPGGDGQIRRMNRLLISLLAILPGGCSKPSPDGAIRWDGKSWRFPGGEVVTVGSMAARGGGVLVVDPAGGATVGACGVWLDGLKGSGSRLHFTGGPELAMHRDASPDSVAMLIEVSGGKLHLLVQAAESEPVTLVPGREAEQIAGALKGVESDAGACAIMLPDDAEPLTAVVEALRLSQSAGGRPVGFVRTPGFSVWMKLKKDPNVKRAGLDRGEGFPVRIRADGGLFVGTLPVDEAQLTELIRAFTGIEPDGHLRLHGGKDAVFRHSRKVIRGAAAAGMSRVVFVTHPEGEGDDCEECRRVPEAVAKSIEAVVKGTIEARESDLDRTVPRHEEKPGDLQLFVQLTAEGVVRAQGLDQTTEEFGKSLDSMIEQGLTPVIQLHVAGDLPQPKVIEFLSLLSGRGIQNVTFMDLK